MITSTRQYEITRTPHGISVADLTSFAETFGDLDDPDVISRAWR